MMGIKTLIVDDEAKYRDLFTEILQGDGHEVHCAKNLVEAREQLKARAFHLIVLDIVLEPDEDGLQLLDDISKLNRDTDSFCAPIIFTGYATKDRALKAMRQGVIEFWEKQVEPEDFIISKIGKESRGFVEQELLDAVRKALRRVLSERKRRYKSRKYSLYLHLAPNQKTRIELTGPTTFVSESSNILEIDISDFSGQTDDLQFHFGAKDEDERLKWRSRAKSIGNTLYKQIFTRDVELNSCLTVARERSVHNPLSIVIRGTQDILRLPIELLPGESGQLVTEHPVTRQILDLKNVRNTGLASFFEEENTPLKVLLIGSNTYPPIPNVDAEIDQLETKMKELFRSRGIYSEIKVIPTKEASYDNVYGFLEQCNYHIVHYSGHGFHDENRSDESGIFFWEKNNKSGSVKSMPIRVLRNLLRKSDVRFFFLSCCVGAKTVEDNIVKLNGNDFQGIMEGLVRVGIPSVLGYRWNVWDTDARQFATAFYESLFTDLSLDVATFNARRVLQEANYYSETWASPVLVMQTQ
jgi:CheY-like chemotaxis protein